MDDKQAEIYTQLLQAQMSRFDATRRIQWTFNSLIWAGIIVTATYLRDIKVDLCVYAIYSACIIVAYMMVIILIQKSLDWDKAKFKAYRGIIENHLKFAESLKALNLKDAPDRGWGSIVWTGAQFIITLLLLIGTYIFTTF